MGDANSVVSMLSLWGREFQGGGGGGGACTYLDSMNIVPSRKYKKYKYSERYSL